MKVIIGADAIRYPLTGIGRYVCELGSRLPAFTDVETLRYLRGSSVRDVLPDRPNTGRTEKASNRLRRLAGDVPMLADVYHYYTTVVQKRALLGFSDYVFHGPNYYLPVHDGPCVSTFHDLSVFKWPECHPAARVRHMQKELPIAIKRANVLLTDSEYTRQEVAAYFGWPLNRIVVTPLAVSPDYHPMMPTEIAHILSRWGLSYGSYSLFVGTMDPRKNVDILLDVYERLPHRLRVRIPLVVVGFEGWDSEKTIARLRVGEKAGWAHYLGFVEELSLPSLYAGARVFLYPSRYEGFGLPVLEAMAAGVPVICSDAASLPEVAGTKGAVFVAADDVDSLYEALLQALEDDKWCVQARAHGLERAKHFSWQKTVAATLTAYKLASKV